MTYRQRFERRLRVCRWGLYAIVLLVTGLFILGRNLVMPDWVGTFVIFPFAVGAFLFLFVAQFRWFGCPACRANLGLYVVPAGWGLGRFRYCPHCAFDLEQEINTADLAIRRP